MSKALLNEVYKGLVGLNMNQVGFIYFLGGPSRDEKRK